MRLLLDTQIALWWLTASPRLPKATRDLMRDSSCAVSVASVWEVDLKHRLGKLPISPKLFRDEMKEAGAALLPIAEEHVLTVVKPAQRHRDPFDRLLVSVAEAESLVLLTADEALIRLRQRNADLPIRAI